MPSLSIACIVEGHGEVQAVLILIRRTAAIIDPALAIDVKPPLRISRSKLIRGQELERAVEFAARKTGNQGGILILVDSDDDCPANSAPSSSLVPARPGASKYLLLPIPAS